MKQLLLTILGATIANILTFIIYQGFVQSYWGKNCREEVTRWFNNMTKHLTKNKDKK